MIAASFKVSGTIFSDSSVERTINGSIIIANATPPASTE